MFVGLSHADDCAKSVRVGVIAGICGTGGEDYGDLPQGWVRFDVVAKIVAWGVFAFHLGNDECGSEDVENFAGVGRVVHGNDVVAFVLQVDLERVAQRFVGVHGEDQWAFSFAPGANRGRFGRARGCTPDSDFILIRA